MIPDQRHGTSFPLGATVLPDGVNFSLFSRQATRIELDPRNHRTYHYWHVFVPGGLGRWSR